MQSSSSMVASLPDISEFSNSTLKEWKDWFTRTAGLVLSRCPDDGVTVFFQSDIKWEGTWVDKAYLCQKAAEEQGHELLWHKVACRSVAGSTTFGRPAYSHVLCFSKGVRAKTEKSSPDVMPELGDKAWERGMGLEVCLMVGRFILEQTTTRTVVNPFCGQGSMLAAADLLGLNSLGIERSPKRADRARTIKVSGVGKGIFFEF